MVQVVDSKTGRVSWVCRRHYENVHICAFSGLSNIIVIEGDSYRRRDGLSRSTFLLFFMAFNSEPRSCRAPDAILVFFRIEARTLGTTHSETSRPKQFE